MITRAVLFEEFAGRSEELAFLVDVRTRAAREAGGGTVIVSGDGGVGKTRLLREFERAIEGERGGCASVRCDEASARPYGPLVDALEILRSARELRAGSAIGEALEALTSASAIVVDDAAEQRQQRLGALRRAIEDAARRMAHLTLIVDDVHASDLASIEALRSLTAIAKRLPLTIVVAYRSDDIQSDLARSRGLAAIEREGADRVALRPLQRNALSKQLRALLPSASSETLARIYDLSEGKPFVAEELARSVVERGAAAGVAAPLSLRSAVLGRLEQLDPTSRAILRRAAVLGKVVRIDDLLADGANTGDVIRALRAARDLQLLEERAFEGEAAFRFRHAITQEIVYGDMLLVERKAMHLEIADRFEARSPQRLAEIAYHLDLSGAVTRAMVACERAGDRALELAAFSDAVALYGRALAAIGTNDIDALVRVAGSFLAAIDGAGELDERYPLLESICDRLEGVGRHLEAYALRVKALMIVATYQSPRAAALLPSVRERMPEGAPPNLRFDAAIAIIQALVLEYRFEEAVAALADAEAAVPTPDSTQTGKLLNAKTMLAYHWQHDHVAAEAHIRAALELAKSVNAGKRIANATRNLGVIAVERGNVREALSLARASSDAFRRAGYLRWASKVDGLAAMFCAQLGDFEAARRLIAAADPDLLGDREWIVARAHLVRAIGGESADLTTAFHDAVARHDTLLVQHIAPELAWSAASKGAAREIVRAALAVSPRFGDDMDFCEAVAAFGDDGDILRLTDHLASLELRDDQRFARAGRRLVEARLDERAHRDLAAAAAAREAFDLFEPIGVWAQRSRALILSGERERALGFLRAIGATAELARITQAGTPNREPARVATLLTQREEQVARLSIAGLGTREIAERLAISPRTVESHFTNLFEKLDVRSRSELAAFFS